MKIWWFLFRPPLHLGDVHPHALQDHHHGGLVDDSSFLVKPVKSLLQGVHLQCWDAMIAVIFVGIMVIDSRQGWTTLILYLVKIKGKCEIHTLSLSTSTTNYYNMTGNLGLHLCVCVYKSTSVINNKQYMMKSCYYIPLKLFVIIIKQQCDWSWWMCPQSQYATWSGSRPVSSRMESNSGGLSSVVSASPILPVIDSG